MRKVIRTTVSQSTQNATPETGDLRPLVEVDYANEGWGTRLIHRFFAWVETLYEYAFANSPTNRAFSSELNTLYTKIGEHAAEMRAKYPEDYARADREMAERREYLKYLP